MGYSLAKYKPDNLWRGFVVLSNKFRSLLITLPIKFLSHMLQFVDFEGIDSNRF